MGIIVYSVIELDGVFQSLFSCYVLHKCVSESLRKGAKLDLRQVFIQLRGSFAGSPLKEGCCHGSGWIVVVVNLLLREVKKARNYKLLVQRWC